MYECKNKWWLDETIPREVILAIVFMETIHWRGLDSQAIARRCSLKSGALKDFINFTEKQLLESILNKVADVPAWDLQLF